MIRSAVVAAALVLAAHVALAQTPKHGRHAHLRGQRRAAQLRLPRADLVRVHPSGAAALLDAAQVRHRATIRSRWATWPSPGPSRRTASPTPSSSERNVKFHDGSPLTSEDIKATYDRMRKPPQGVLSMREETFKPTSPRSTRPIRYTVVFKLKKPNASMLSSFASPVGLRLQRRQAQGRSASFPSATSSAPARSPSSSTQAGSHWVGKQVRRLFREGQAVPRRLSGRVHQRRADGQRACRRPGAGRIPRPSPADRDRLVQGAGRQGGGAASRRGSAAWS